MEIRHLLKRDFIHVSVNTSAQEILKLFLKYRQDIACIIENKKLVGIVTKYSIYRLLIESGSLDSSIEPVIIKDVVTLQETDSVYDAKKILIENDVGHAVVLDSNHEVTRVITKADVINGLIAESNNLANRLKLLMDNLQESVISVDSNLCIASINKTALKLFNMNEDSVLCKPIESVFPTLAYDLAEVISSDKVIDIKRLDINTTTAYASFFTIKEWGNITGAMAVLKDITDFENIAKELESTKRIEKTLDSALEVSYDAVAITDNHGRITKANPGFLTIFGYQSIDEIIHKSIKTILPDIDVQRPKSEESLSAAEIIQINGEKAILNQMPIHQNNEKIGHIYKIIYQQLEIWKDLFQHMEKLENELTYYRDELSRISDNNDPFFSIVSTSRVMDELKEEALIAGKGFSNVLITGESGTGKELLADGIHRASGRSGPFIKMNCSAFPENLLESEFFGYSDGAFTGARKGGKPGKFELAHKGTIFLDEIGDMPLTLQAKLLRVLQEKEFERVGGTETIKVDVRIIAATNKDLLKLVNEGEFREDLYYRLHVINLHIPPLRKRLDDIPILVEHFLKKFKTKINKQVLGLTPEAIYKLQSYHWPGNVRQLENILERAYHFTDSKWIEPNVIIFDTEETISATNFSEASKSTVLTNNRENILQDADKMAICKALEYSKGNRTKAAQMLGISRSTLYLKMKKYNIQEKVKWH